ncbi:hypothetical protein SOVF_160080 [Spinacia oleracea]|nr:hypothetical protein SOVF_160080 [Spinacia oleracea]
MEDNGLFFLYHSLMHLKTLHCGQCYPQQEQAAHIMHLSCWKRYPVAV